MFVSELLNYWILKYRCFHLSIWSFCLPTELEYYNFLRCVTAFLIFQSWEIGDAEQKCQQKELRATQGRRAARLEGWPSLTSVLRNKLCLKYTSKKVTYKMTRNLQSKFLICNKVLAKNEVALKCSCLNKPWSPQLSRSQGGCTMIPLA